VGIIEKITMMKDEFVLNRNGVKEERISGSAHSPMSLSTFMDKLKVIQSDIKKYNFIQENSDFIQFYTEDEEIVYINYLGKQLYNFFVINFDDMVSFPLDQLEGFIYQWGKFKIKFESLTLKNDCLAYYQKRISEINDKK
jgi:hypothetical protein